MKQNDLITEMHTDIKWIKKELEGNGKQGLIDRVASIEKWRWLITGSLLILSGLFGFNLGGLI